MEIPARERKAALRKQLAAARANRDDDQRARLGAALALHAPTLQSGPTVAAYVGVGTELPTAPLIEALYGLGVRVLLPAVRPGGALDWADSPVSQAMVSAGALGLLEPTGPLLGPDAVRGAEVLLVPALAVDRQGHRLGRGGGYYDRLLGSGLRTATARVIAVVFDDEILDHVPAELHDAGVDGALTPSGLDMFGR